MQGIFEKRLKIVFRTGALGFLLVMVLCFVVYPVQTHARDLTAMAKASTVGSDTCLGCHEDFSNRDHLGFHGLKSGGWSKVGCEACHGPGSLHAESEDPEMILHPGDDDESMQNNCLVCHASVNHGWKAHHMEISGTTCLSCHQIHQETTKGTLKKQEPDLCYTCHTTIQAKFHLPSHHPMMKGKILCSSCHDMTGKDVLSKERVNDTCLNCHAQYRGPFVYEHAPVAEDCTICHDPHGAVANNLLKQNEPFLCLSCHQMHFHTQLPGYEGDFTSPVHPERGGHSQMKSFKHAMLTKCTQCHPQVHGTDLPSQALSGQGKALTR